MRDVQVYVNFCETTPKIAVFFMIFEMGVILYIYIHIGQC